MYRSKLLPKVFMQKYAGILGAGLSGGLGAVRAHNLSDSDRRIIEAAYDLPDNANLGLRNAGRGMVGGFTGSVLGSAIVGLPALGIHTKIQARTPKIKKLKNVLLGKSRLSEYANALKHSKKYFVAGGILGGLGGALRDTNKYSTEGVDEAKQILARRLARYNAINA